MPDVLTPETTMSAKKKIEPTDGARVSVDRVGTAKSRNAEAALELLKNNQPAVALTDTPRSTHMVAILLHGDVSDDRMEIYRAVRNGFPLQSVINMIEHSDVYKQYGVLSRIVGASDRTLARRLKSPEEVLTSEQSTRALYYAEVLEKATDVLGSRELAEQWMVKPARGLDGEMPIDLISNSVGYELVTDFLTRIEYGVY
jgi:putative toxin-antitoxin system antitoxin component (TIGR02293 family)